MTANRPNLLKLLAPLAAFAVRLPGAHGASRPRATSTFHSAGPAWRPTSPRAPRPTSASPSSSAPRARASRRPGLRLARRRLPAEGPRHRRSLLLLARRAQLRRWRCAATRATSTPCWARGRWPDSATTSASSCVLACEAPPAGARARRVAPGDRRRPDRARPLRRRGATLQRMLDTKPNLTSYARVSYFRELNGDLEGALQSMRLAVSAGAAAPENVAYLQTLIGDLELQRNRPAAARTAYRVGAGPAARLCPRRRRARAGRQRGRRPGRRRPPAAAAWPGGFRSPATSSCSPTPTRPAGRSGRRRATSTWCARSSGCSRRPAQAGRGADRLRGHSRRPRAAVRLGRRLWAEAPSVRSADALGWALTRAGRPEAGLAWSERALRLGTPRAALPPPRWAGGEGRRAGRAGATSCGRRWPAARRSRRCRPATPRTALEALR